MSDTCNMNTELQQSRRCHPSTRKISTQTQLVLMIISRPPPVSANPFLWETLESCRDQSSLSVGLLSVGHLMDKYLPDAADTPPCPPASPTAAEWLEHRHELRQQRRQSEIQFLSWAYARRKMSMNDHHMLKMSP